MPSIFDFLFGNSQAANSAGGATPPINPAAPPTPRPPSILDSPEYGQQRLTDALQGLAMGLVQAGAPSPYPKGFAETFGAAGAGIGQGMANSEDRYLKRAMVNSQVKKNEAELARDKALNDLFTGGGSGGSTATGTDSATWKVPQAAVPTTAVAGTPAGQPNDPTNPGNISDGKGGFQSFPSPEAGVAAAVKLAQSYPGLYNNGQPMSLAQIEARWAPPDDGKTPQLKGNKQGVWSGNVAKVMGVDPNVPVDFSNPDTARKFAQAVHVAEHGAQKAYTPDVYDRGVQMAYGGLTRTPPAQGAGEPPAGGSIVPAQYQPPQAGAGPAPIPQFKTVQDVVNSIPPAVRQLAPGMTTDGKLQMLMKYADPGTETALDTQTGQVVFVPKNLIGKDPRYQPVKGAELAIAARNAAASEAQAKAREEANRIRGANEPMQPPTVPGGAPTPTPGFAEQQGAVEAAKETAKIQPKVVIYQAEQAIKDHGETQQAASKARTDLNDLKQLDTLLKGIETGKMTPATQEMKAWAKAAGFNLDTLGVKDDVANTQAAQSLLNRMTLQMRNAGEGGGMPGSMSDADRQFLQKIPPGLETTPEGRRLIIDYMTRVNQRTIDIAKIKNQFMQSEEATRNPAAMWQKVQEFADKNPLFTDKDQIPAAPAAPAALTPQAIDAELERRRKAGR
jgi:hypothetical protein